MSTPGAVRRQQSRITVEYYEPPIESIREYRALLDQAILHEHPGSSLPSYVPSKQPSLLPPSSFKHKDPPPPPTTHHQRRNPLQKPPPRNREPGIQTSAVRAGHTLDSSIPNNTTFGPTKSSYPRRDGSSSYGIPPSRASRVKPIILDDMFPSRSTSTRVIRPFKSFSVDDPTPHLEEVHGDPSILYSVVDSPSTPRPAGVDTTSTKGATVTKGKKGVLGFMSNLLRSNKRVGISAPSNLSLIANTGSNASDVEFTELTEERQQLLPGGGDISRNEQEDQKVIMDIVKFHPGGGEDVWAKTGGALKNGLSVLPAPPPKQLLVDESFCVPQRPTLDPPKRPRRSVPPAPPPRQPLGETRRIRWHQRDPERDQGEREKQLKAVPPASSPATSLSSHRTLRSPLDERLASDNPHDAVAPSVAGSACELLIRQTYPPQDLSFVMDQVLSDKDGTETIHRLTVVDAQTLIDVIDKILETPDLPLWTRKKCLRLLYRTCGYHARLPSALAVPIWYDRTGNILYRGGYADVWKGKHRGEDVAVKVIRTYSNDELQKVVNAFCKEVVAWKFLRHPNVLPLIGVLMSENQFAMASKWMANGNINQYIKAHPEADRFRLLTGVAEGLMYLHDNEMVHGDLKGVNILIDKTGHPRLADFGLLTIISDPANFFSSSSYSQGGTVRWMSPELIDPERFGLEKSRRTISSDCYALGMVIYETISGNIPFHQHIDLTVSLKVIAGEHPAREAAFPRHVWKMLKQCWVPHPDDRPSIGDVHRCLRKAAGSLSRLS